MQNLSYPPGTCYFLNNVYRTSWIAKCGVVVLEAQKRYATTESVKLLLEKFSTNVLNLHVMFKNYLEVEQSTFSENGRMSSLNRRIYTPFLENSTNFYLSKTNNSDVSIVYRELLENS
ncbi:hypothetical protein WN51_09644 [Melipona quadrifasciata]|uniref:Uncharacterized protein n=1 Tax=Melipona quadrifasciata TaxID=166423 RepID=A0A0N0BIB7_9HYME|nr:hypothetical protein WN51_09644 [Melipona quadrifasciata]